MQFPFVQKPTAKKPSKLDNQMYLSPQKTLELPANQPESFPGGTWRDRNRKEMKRTIFKWVPVLAVIKPVKFYKKTTIKRTFCLVKRLVTSAKGFLSWNEEKRKRQQKEEKYVRFLLEETGTHLPVHHGRIFCNLDMDCFAMVVLLQFLTAAARHVSRDLPAIYLAVGCTWINHKCRDVAEGRLAYMINLADTAHLFLKIMHYFYELLS